LEAILCDCCMNHTPARNTSTQSANSQVPVPAETLT
jgi:hypothetical protein